MLKLNDAGWLRWGAEDVRHMTEILGPDEAAKERTPLNPAVLLAARRHRVLLSARCSTILSQAISIRKDVRDVKRWHLDDDSPDCAVPNKLFVHQRSLLAFLQRMSFLRGFLVADEPGVGKTPPSIIWASQFLKTRALIITPNSAKYQWAREIKRWGLALPRTIVEGKIAEQTRIAREANGWVIAHWESIANAAEGYLERPWDVIIADECHAIGNRDAKRSTVAHQLKAHRRMALTGHPYANTPEELYSILKFLQPGDEAGNVAHVVATYSSFWRFFSMHVLVAPGRWSGYDVLGTRDRKILRWEIAPFTIRRTKREVYKTLPATHTARVVELVPSARKEYEKLRKEFFVELQQHRGAKRILAIPSVLARGMRLRQYLIDPGILEAKEKSPKYQEVLDLIRNEVKAPVVIFTSFATAAKRLGRFLTKANLDVDYVLGGQSPARRNDAQAAFLAGQLNALIVTTKAGGTALNLGKFGYVIFLDLPWTARDVEQAVGRVDRPEEGTGKMVPTTVYHVVVKDSYEMKIVDLIEQKNAMFNEVFGSSLTEKVFA
jgi:SNF2 family DNA or RNA helicase